MKAVDQEVTTDGGGGTFKKDVMSTVGFSDDMMKLDTEALMRIGDHYRDNEVMKENLPPI